MMTLPKVTALILALSALAACGGGGGGDGGGGGGPITPPKYLNLSNSTNALNSELEGRILIVGASDAEIRAISGTLRHSTRALTGLTDGYTISLSDPGPDNSGTWTDGTITFAPFGSQSGNFNFAAFYELTAASGSGIDSGLVVIGVSMDAGDIPTENTTLGGVTYNGAAFVDGSTDPGGAGQSLGGTGNSIVFVDFVGNTVDLTINNVSGGAPLPYTSLMIEGMTIDPTDRSVFSGGTLTIMDGAVPVTNALLGTNVATTTGGDFFGADANDNPDEVGGLFSATGDGTGEIFGGFIAD